MNQYLLLHPRDPGINMNRNILPKIHLTYTQWHYVFKSTDKYLQMNPWLPLDLEDPASDRT